MRSRAETIRMNSSCDRCEKATNLLVELCKESFGNRLSSVILYGSAAIQDTVAGFSDLDVMLVMENHARGPLDYALLRSIKERVARETGIAIHESWVFGRSLLLSVPTIWETLSARTIYGEFIVEKAPIPDLNKRTSIKMMHDLKSQWDRRKGILDLRERARTALSQTLKFAQNALLCNDIVKETKEDIVETFEESFRGFRMRRFPRRAYESIMAWEEVNGDEEKLRQIVEDFEQFHDYLYWFVALKTLLE